MNIEKIKSEKQPIKSEEQSPIFVKTISGSIHPIPMHWKYVNLFSNEMYEICLSAECGHVDLSKQLFIFCNQKYIIRVNSQESFPDSILRNSYFRKIRIQYKYEFIEICPDTFTILRRSAISSHIRVVCINQGFDIQNGIYSLRFQKHYPIHRDLRLIKISIASLAFIEIKSDLITDQRHEINIKFYPECTEKCTGELINHNIDNCIDSLYHTLSIINI